MSVEIISQDGSELVLQVKLDLAGSMLAVEEHIQSACNEVGLTGTETALARFDTDGSAIVAGGVKYTVRGRDDQTYQSPYGAVKLPRYVYQTSAGGGIYCPLESAARIIHGATPRFAKTLPHKYSNMSANDVRNDLESNHLREISKKYIQKVATSVGEVAQEKEAVWSYQLPEFDKKITTVSIGLDGAHLLMHKEGWREGMVGAVSLYDKTGMRQHTIYIACPPEYGKKIFLSRLEKEINRIKDMYPKAQYIGIADGAKDNWPYLERHTDKQLLDFYHATEYLTRCSHSAHSDKTQKSQRLDWLKKRCHQLKHKVGASKAILKQLKALSRKKKLSRVVREDLEAAITYFQNNLHRMNYAEHVKKKLPIGSGVTEAACKTLIKQRLCCSGMRWKNTGVKIVLRLRELIQTKDRWQQFWNKLNQYGLPAMA